MVAVVVAAVTAVAVVVVMADAAADTVVPEEAAAEVIRKGAMVCDTVKLREDALLTCCRWRRKSAVRRK